MAGRRFNRSLRADGRWRTDAGGGQVGRSPQDCSSNSASMPHKKNANGRHHIPKMRHAAANWAKYEGGLRRRSSLTLWITDEAITAWSASRRATPGGQATYSDSAIQTCLMPRAAFKLALRQAKGFDAVGRGTAGLRARQSGPYDRQPTGGATGIDHPRAAARFNRQHWIEGVRRWPVADGKGTVAQGAVGASCTSAWMPAAGKSWRSH